MNFYSNEAQEVLSELQSSKDGLSQTEAEARLARDGKNKLEEHKGPGVIRRFFAQMADPMILVLLAAAALSAVTAVYSGESFADAIIILLVVILNSVLGVVQESKAEKAIEALSAMTAAHSRVIRDGQVRQVPSDELVKGDIVLIEAGDAIPADMRLLECASLKIEEAALTGESVPSDKDSGVITAEKVPLGDRHNMAYTGSSAVYGRGTGVVCATGMDTEMGKIAAALRDAKEGQTPLQKKLSGLSKILTFLVLGISAVIFAVSIIRSGGFSGALDAFMLAVSLAVAAVPEGLAAVVTIVLSMGVTAMSKRGAVIRRLTAVETLGCAQVICTDKTGTLTQNKMTVVDSFGEDEAELARAMALCSDAELTDGEAVGEPTECALVNYAAKLGFDKPSLKEQFPRTGEAPFDSLRKMMSTIHGNVQYTKGAPDEIIARCTHILTSEGVCTLSDETKERLLKENKRMADEALRVLAAAKREYDAPPEAADESGMIFLGMYGMIDPVRPEVKASVERCREAGITPVMITGDHIDTASAIGRQLGILEKPSQAIEGKELDGLSDEQLDSYVENLRVYARVQPEHKVRIVKAWQRLGKVTAMTGDGVNDAPSIKTADIGVGMGITGTDVTKNVADMVLADDNFATIVAAVGEGRRIYDNIRRAVQFLLSSNLSEVIGIFIATLAGFTLLKPVQILWINLITDSLPALALGMEKGEKDAMTRPPRDPKEGIFAGGVAFEILYQGTLVAGLTLAAYFIGGNTAAFLTLSMAEIVLSFCMRSMHGSVFTLGGENKWLWGAAAAALLLSTAVIYIPGLNAAFSFEALSLAKYAISLLLALAVLPVVELVKLIRRAVKK